mmetsp:Transcript_2415/g.5119  ORF Transcript_2415/g.5119 Transcript_2415/m.5119 type:complete len:286 (-) Transcript_2415:25-882(-)
MLQAFAEVALGLCLRRPSVSFWRGVDWLCVSAGPHQHSQADELPHQRSCPPKFQAGVRGPQEFARGHRRGKGCVMDRRPSRRHGPGEVQSVVHGFIDVSGGIQPVDEKLADHGERVRVLFASLADRASRVRVRRSRVAIVRPQQVRGRPPEAEVRQLRSHADDAGWGDQVQPTALPLDAGQDHWGALQTRQMGIRHAEDDRRSEARGPADVIRGVGGEHPGYLSDGGQRHCVQPGPALRGPAPDGTAGGAQDAQDAEAGGHLRGDVRAGERAAETRTGSLHILRP